MDFNYKNILIFGYGGSGRAVEDVLKDIKKPYKIYDKKVRIGGGCYILKLSKKVLSQFDLIVVSPGVSVFNKYLRIADNMGIKVIGELEFGYWFTTGKIIAVTGTNGKTSTVQLISEMLSNAGYNVGAYGNIGTPLSRAYGIKLDYIICEVSSFQLETTDKFVGDVGVLLNVDEDHLDRHKTLRNYINCKKDLFKNCNTNSIVVLNDDDETCHKFANDVTGKVMLTSKCNIVNGVYVKNASIYYKNNNETIELFNINKNKINATYLDNLLACIAVGISQNIPKEVILKTLKNWKVMPHRIEFVSKNDGVTYINDSKSTNIHSVIKAIESVNGNVILLMGGKNKKLNFNNFFKNLASNVVQIITFGDAKKYLAKLAKKYNLKVNLAKDIKTAVMLAKSYAQKGDTILFSPGCTSFDNFNNYAERGDYFKKVVWDVLNNEK